MNMIVPITINIVEIIIAPVTRTKSFARLSGSFTSLNNSFNGSRVILFYLTRNMYCVVVGSSFRSVLISCLYK